MSISLYFFPEKLYNQPLDAMVYHSHTRNEVFMYMTTTQATPALADNKQTQAYQQIKEAIMSNQFPPGSPMVERRLSEMYNVSRSPIRNALQQLIHDGLLTFSPGKGVIVPEYNTEDILEIFDIMEMLQTHAVKYCIRTLDETATETLNVLLRHMRSCIDSGDILSNTRWDQQFHRFIVSRAANKRLETMFEQMNNQQIRCIVTILDDPVHAENSYKQHAAIRDAIVNRDEDAAIAAIRNHYKEVKQYYINKLLARISI